MTDKRRNFLILGLVVVLMAGSLALIATRDFRLGLDLKGGIEVVLEARPDAGTKVTPAILNTSADILRRRVDPQGVLSPEIRTSSSDNQITVAVPGAKNAQEVADLLVATGELQSFDLFKYLNTVSTAGSFQAKPSTTLWDLLTAAKSQVKDESDVNGWALFDKTTKQQFGKIEPQKSQVLQDIAGKAQPEDPVWLAVPKGTSVVSCVAADGCPGVTATQGTYYYLFNLNPNERGNPNVITGDQVTADASTDPQSGSPDVTLTYRNGGGDEFKNITQDMVVRKALAQSQWPQGLPNAIVVDGRLVSWPVVDQVIDPSLSGNSEHHHRRSTARPRSTGSRWRSRAARCRSSSRPSRPR